MKNNNSLEKVITRFAPSPTGTLHTGGVRTALFSYLFAKQHGGKYILRIDDTDKIRSTKEFEKDIVDGLHWLGLQEDAIYYQSQRTDLYKAKLQQLLAEDKIYISQEKIEKEGDRAEVIRFRNPNTKVTFHDLIKGEISFDTTELGDFVIAKDLETPLYHFASVVDDLDLGITHVIRGEDHVSNTPRQILMWEALGGPVPQFAHLPMILAPDRTKLSKRKHASIASANEFIKRGYLPEAVLNYVALVGWSPQSIHEPGQEADNEEIFDLATLLQKFDLSKVQISGAIFNIEKLNWLNKEYIKRQSSYEQLIWIKKFFPTEITGVTEEKLRLIAPILIDRISYYGELEIMHQNGELQYFFSQPSYDQALLKNTTHLPKVIELLSGLEDTDFTIDKIKSAIWDFATEQGRGEVLWPMRVALSGQAKSPDPFTLAFCLGKEETIARLNNAINLR